MSYSVSCFTFTIVVTPATGPLYSCPSRFPKSFGFVDAEWVIRPFLGVRTVSNPVCFHFSDETWSLWKRRYKQLERTALARDLAVKSEKNYDGSVLTQHWSVEKPTRRFLRWWVAKMKKNKSLSFFAIRHYRNSIFSSFLISKYIHETSFKECNRVQRTTARFAVYWINITKLKNKKQ